MQIVLTGKSNPEHRVSILSLLFSKAEEKINHIDGLRQRNMNYALVLFSGLSVLATRLNTVGPQRALSIMIAVIMLIFCLWDRKLHKIRHGWQETSRGFCRGLEQMLRDSLQDVMVLRYDASGEKKAEWFSQLPVIFYVLVATGVASWFLFPWLTVGMRA